MGLFSFAESMKFLGLSSASSKGPRFIDVHSSFSASSSSHGCPGYPGRLSRVAIQGNYPGQLPRASPPPVRIPPLHSSPAPTRVKSALHHWKKIAGPWHLRLIQEGIPLEWIDVPHCQTASSTRHLAYKAGHSHCKLAGTLSPTISRSGLSEHFQTRQTPQVSR